MWWSLRCLSGASVWVRRHIAEQPKAQTQVIPLLNDTDVLVLPASATEVGGGGGGGDREKLEASKGKLPTFAMQQITPPLVVVRNVTPKLPLEPTVVVPPEIRMTPVNLPNLGDPMVTIPNGPPSNGTGSAESVPIPAGASGRGKGRAWVRDTGVVSEEACSA